MSDVARATLDAPPTPAQTPAEYRLHGLWDCIRGDTTGAMVAAYRQRIGPCEPDPKPSMWLFTPVKITGDPPRSVALRPHRHVFEPADGNGGITYRTIGPADVPEAITVQLAHVEGVTIVEREGDD